MSFNSFRSKHEHFFVKIETEKIWENRDKKLLETCLGNLP